MASIFRRIRSRNSRPYLVGCWPRSDAIGYTQRATLRSKYPGGNYDVAITDDTRRSHSLPRAKGKLLS